MLVHKIKLYFCLWCTWIHRKHQDMEEDIQVKRFICDLEEHVRHGSWMFKKKATFVFLLASKMLAMGLLWYFFFTWNSAKAVKMSKAITDYYYFFPWRWGFFFFFLAVSSPLRVEVLWNMTFTTRRAVKQLISPHLQYGIYCIYKQSQYKVR